MKIVEQSVKLLHCTCNALELIEKCGRVCYKSELKGDPAGFVEMLIDQEHLSVIEHASATFLFVCDRGVSHELVRHRLASFSQESTRFCNYGKEEFGNEITVIKPPGLEGINLHCWKKTCQLAEQTYLRMIRDGLPPQIARSVLPTCLKTEIAVTANFREWMHIFRLRISKAAHPQMRELMKMAYGILKELYPSVFV